MHYLLMYDLCDDYLARRVTRYRVRQWNTVVGENAFAPVRL